jgi:hypothetical protein
VTLPNSTLFLTKPHAALQVVAVQLSRARRQLLQAREGYSDLVARHRSQQAAEAVLHNTLTALAGMLLPLAAAL